jgi:hypothetical protein
MQKKSDKWGVGMDHLFKDIWPDLDKIREDNLHYVHDDKNIEHCFSVMYSILSRDAIAEVKKSDWEPKDKLEVLQKITDILKHFKEAETINDKVIAINVAEQLLRAIY